VEKPYLFNLLERRKIMNAEVLVKFKGDTKDLDKETSKAQSSLKGFASGVSSAFKVATGVVAGTTIAVGTLVKKSVEAYAEFEQLEGGLESLFGKGSTEMQKILAKSEQAYMDLTMSQNEYLNSFEKSYPLVNAGLSEGADSIEYTNKMLQLSSDLYNTYGGSVENYQNAINWALKGSFVYLDNLNLGIKGTQEGFIEAANSSGVLKKNITDVKELTNDEIIDVIQHYAQEYGVWGKTSEEASKTILGSMNMTKAAWSNFIAGLSKDGADIDKLVDNLVNSALKFGENIMPVIMRALESIVNALPKIVDAIGKELPKLIKTLLPPLIKAINSLIKAIASALPDLLNTLIPLLTETLLVLIESIAQNLPMIIQALMQGLITIIQAIAQALPTLIPIIVQAVLDGLMAILDNIDLLIDAGIQLLFGLMNGLIQALPVLIEKLPEIIEKVVNALVENMPKLVEAGIMLIIELAKGLIKALPQLISKIPQIISTLVNGFINYYKKLFELGGKLLDKIKDGISNGISKIAQVGKNLISGLWNGITSKVDWIIGKIKGFGSSVMKAIKGIFGVHSPSTEFEWIGKMNMEGLEKGMEELQPQLQKTINGMFDLQPNVSGSMQSTYSPQMNIVVNNNVEMDPLGQVVNNIKTFSGGAKNDYNWGASL
jgi:phage-related protein